MIIIHQLIVWFFSLTILSHNIVEPPVLCLDDKHIDIENNCSTGLLAVVSHYFETDSGAQDDCLNCIDIPLGTHASVFKRATNVDNRISDQTDFSTAIHPLIFYKQYAGYSDPVKNILSVKTQPQLALVYSRLLL